MTESKKFYFSDKYKKFIDDLLSLLDLTADPRSNYLEEDFFSRFCDLAAKELNFHQLSEYLESLTRENRLMLEWYRTRHPTVNFQLIDQILGYVFFDNKPMIEIRDIAYSWDIFFYQGFVRH